MQRAPDSHRRCSRSVVEHAARQTEDEFFAPLSLEEREQLTGLLMRLAETTETEPTSDLMNVDGD